MTETSNTSYDDSYFDWLDETALGSARLIVPIVMELMHVRSVVDVGCGRGAWLSVFEGLGVKHVLGIDAPHVDPERLAIPRSRFMAHDLRKPLRHNERFDLVVCLEVAEHLPLSSAASLIQTLVDLGPVILFSAAIPGQGGLGHVNEQWPDYWAALFAQHGYRPIDCIRPRVWDDPRVEVWYAQNTILFASPHAIDHNSSFRMLSNLPPTPFSIVHPRLFLEPRRPTVRALMSAIKASLVGYAKRGILALLAAREAGTRTFGTHRDGETEVETDRPTQGRAQP